MHILYIHLYDKHSDRQEKVFGRPIDDQRFNLILCLDLFKDGLCLDCHNLN